MESVRKSLKSVKQTIFPKKTKKARKVKFSKNSKSSHNSTRSKKSINSKSPTHKFKRSVKDIQGKLINIDDLIVKVDELDVFTKNAFKKKPKKIPSNPNSPIILSVKNLDTGKVNEATVIKDLNTGKYELYKLSVSK